MSQALLTIAKTVLTLSPISAFSTPLMAILDADRESPEDRLRALTLSLGMKKNTSRFVKADGSDRIYKCLHCEHLELLRANTRPVLDLGVSDMFKLSKMAGALGATQGSNLKAILKDLKDIIGINIGNVESLPELVALFADGKGKFNTTLDDLYFALAGDDGNYIHTCGGCGYEFNFSLKET